jgi:tryptophan-rich sensory protein
MGELASKGQLRNSYLRWALVAVPSCVFLGFLMSQVSDSGYSNQWFLALDRPSSVPPGWVFGLAWTILYVMQGLALAVILNARGAKGRAAALGWFALQFVLNLSWSPLFFGAHQVTASLFLIVLILALAIVTTFSFAKIRKVGAWLFVPYLVWLSFASIITWQINSRNPNAELLVPGRPEAQILL